MHAQPLILFSSSTNPDQTKSLAFRKLSYYRKMIVQSQSH